MINTRMYYRLFVWLRYSKAVFLTFLVVILGWTVSHLINDNACT